MLAVNLNGERITVRPGQRVSTKVSKLHLIMSLFPLTRSAQQPATSRLHLSFQRTKGNTISPECEVILNPPVTGDYTFWIASDNSSELWLSTTALHLRPEKSPLSNRGLGEQA